MSTINPILNQQTQRIAQNSALRKAAAAPQPPRLTADENSFIKEKFTAPKPMQSYAMDGRMSQQQVVRGSHFDARV